MRFAHTFSRFARVGAASALALGGLGLMSPAHAHDELVSSNPAADAKVSEAPSNIELTYSGDITNVDGANQVRVVDSEGENISQGNAKIEGKTVTQKIAGHGSENDTYTVTWRVVSQDGHPIQGEYKVTVGEGKADSSTSASASDEASATATESAEAAENASANTNNGLKIGVFVVLALAVIGAIIAVIAKTRKAQR